jgi:hypothetical protein
VFDVVVQPVRMLVTEQDVVVMEEEDCGSTTVVPVLKIEGFAGSSLPRFPRAGSCATSIPLSQVKP